MTEQAKRTLGAATALDKSFRTQPPDPIRRRWRGCLLGGAVGDALGAPVEFMSLAEIRERFGPSGIVDYTTAFERPGTITDDTQLMLFTGDGLLRTHIKQSLEGNANVAVVVSHAYQRWLMTQGSTSTLLDRTWTSRFDFSLPVSDGTAEGSGTFGRHGSARKLDEVDF